MTGPIPDAANTMRKKRSTSNSKSLAKGLLAGLIGGIAAVAVRTVAEKFYPPLTNNESPGSFSAEALAGSELALPAHSTTTKAVWAEGALAGAAYGAIAEFYPAATAKDGAGFGMTMVSLKQDGALAAIGLATASAAPTPRERARQITLHVVFGVVTETVRRTVRHMLD